MGGSPVVRRTSQKAVMIDRCISVPADALSGTGCMITRRPFVVRATPGGGELCAPRGSIRPETTTIKRLPASDHLNVSKLAGTRALFGNLFSPGPARNPGLHGGSWA